MLHILIHNIYISTIYIYILVHIHVCRRFSPSDNEVANVVLRTAPFGCVAQMAKGLGLKVKIRGDVSQQITVHTVYDTRWHRCKDGKLTFVPFYVASDVTSLAS